MLVHANGRPAFIKSPKARGYERDFRLQCKKLDPLMEGDLAVEITIHYATRRPDLDESLILDCMQGLIYENDRQVKEKHIFHRLDETNPRTEIRVKKL
jgi:Holliday junction resolvase RusA-like endonuclease